MKKMRTGTCHVDRLFILAANVIFTLFLFSHPVQGFHVSPLLSSPLSNRRLIATKLSEKDNGQVASLPLSSKAALLIEKAKSMDENFAKGLFTGSYCEIGWSNRLGTVLTPAAIPGVYAADRPFYWNKIDVGGCMAVIQLSPSSPGAKPDLFIHSPVGIDEELKSALDDLGTVKHVVSPNYEHVKYAKQWAEQYPDAYLWGCPGLMEQEPDIPFTGELPFGCRPPTYSSESTAPAPVENMWDWTEIQPLHVNIETNPFTGKPFFNEVIFYHTPSKTLITTDLYWNYPGTGITNEEYESLPGGSKSKLAKEEGLDFGVWELAPEVSKVPIGSRLWKFGMDKVYKPFYLNLMVKKDKRDEFQKIVSFVLGRGEGGGGWDIETIVPAHGDIVRGRTLVRTVLQKFFNIG